MEKSVGIKAMDRVQRGTCSNGFLDGLLPGKLRFRVRARARGFARARVSVRVRVSARVKGRQSHVVDEAEHSENNFELKAYRED